MAETHTTLSGTVGEQKVDRAAEFWQTRDEQLEEWGAIEELARNIDARLQKIAALAQANNRFLAQHINEIRAGTPGNLSHRELAALAAPRRANVHLLHTHLAALRKILGESR